MGNRKPSVIVCPGCRGMRVNRLHRKCALCKIPLIYVGEFFVREDGGFIWTGKEWMPMEELP